VHLLDGLPLALELAAARLALLTPAQLRDRLRASPDVLTDAGAGRLDRHRSLEATVDWTLRMLEDAPRALFMRLGAFAGPVELEELEGVAGVDGLDVFEALAGLLDVALVRRVESGDGHVRFALPEALRQIAARRLDAAPDGSAWRHAHAQRQTEIVWAARWLCQAAGADYRAAMAADAEADAALRWARAHGDPLAAPLGAAHAGLLADVGRMREAFALLEPILATPSGDPVLDSHALLMQGYALMCAERMDEALAFVARALAIAADPMTRSWAFLIRGLVHTFSDELAAGVRDSEQATALAPRSDAAFFSGVLAIEAQARLFAGDVDGAARLDAEAERIGAPVDTQVLLFRDTYDGDLAMRTGRPHDALEHFARSLEAAQSLGNRQVLLDLRAAAHALAELGEDADALEMVGLAEAQAADMFGAEAAPTLGLPGPYHLVAAEARVGAAAAAELKARGRAVPPGGRIVRACQLARAHEPA